MNAFVSTYPDIVAWLVGLLLTTIGCLFSGLIYMLKMAVDRLSDVIKELRLSLEIDQISIGLLKDRMKEQETTCSMQRAHCLRRFSDSPPAFDQLAGRS